MTDVTFYAILASGDGKFVFKKINDLAFEVEFMGKTYKGDYNPDRESIPGWGAMGKTYTDLPHHLFGCRIGQPWVASAHRDMLHCFFGQLMSEGEKAFDRHEPRLVGDGVNHASVPLFSKSPYKIPLMPQDYDVKHGLGY